MRVIDPIVLANLSAEVYRPAVILHMNILGNNLRYTTWQSSIMVSSAQYVPHGISFNAIRYGKGAIVDTVTIKIDDLNKDVYSLLKNVSSQDIPVNISIAVLDQYESVLGVSNLFKGSVGGWNYYPGFTELKVVSIFEQWARVSVSLFSTSCRWSVFGGQECKYSVTPGEVCDRTYTTCDSFGNTANFGGFRWVPTLIDKPLDPKGIPLPPAPPISLPPGIIR